MMNPDFHAHFGWPAGLERPIAIAHRGASDHAPENTLKAFRIAAELGAEMWELDVRLSADGIAMVVHDGDLARVAGAEAVIAEMSAADLQAIPLNDGERVPRLTEVIALAAELGCGLYIELKDAAAGPVALSDLRASGYRFAAIGAFDPTWIAALREAGCEYPLSVLVPRGADPISYAALAAPDIIHPCWLGAADRPDALITPELIDSIRNAGAEIVTWHEDRPEVIVALQAQPILGICGNRPEVLKPKRGAGPQLVCHRGANWLAPENTIEAARICFDQRFDYVELDVRTTADGHLVVMHDATLERTTNGTGLVCDATLADIQALDAGGWFSDHHAGMRVPTLAQMLDFAAPRGGLYIEIKHASPSQILREVRAAGMLERVFFWGADTDALHWLRTQGDEIMLMAPRWMYASVEAAHADYRAQIIELDVTRDDLAELVDIRRIGLKSMIYSTTQDDAELARYLDLGPDLVNLDRPDRFKLIADYGFSA